MKLRRIIVGMTAAALALSMTISASAATYLFDVVHPDEADKEVNDAFYSIGAMGFYMSQKWNWNQSEWIPINDEGVIEFEYHIDEPMTDTTMSGKGTLGDMGVMLLNLPKDGYPYNIEISDCKFVAEDGTVTEFPKINSTTIANEDAEGGYRIHIRPTAELDDDGNVKKTARPEVKGWDQEGAFKGGTLSMKINLNVDSIDTEEDGIEPYVPEEDAAAGEEAGEEAAEETKEEATEEKKEEEAAGGEEAAAAENPTTTSGDTAGAGGTSPAAAGTGSGNGGTTAQQQESNAQTGAASNAILAAMAMAAAGMIASKKRK